MCGRFIQYSDPEIYAKQFGLDEIDPVAPSYNVAPSQQVMIIRQRPTGVRELMHVRWGLIPSWSKGPDNRYTMINARAETVGHKPAYRTAFRRRRCLIPTEGFYEWRTLASGKQPYLIRRKDQAPFAMAGIREVWHGKNSPPVESCSIIVTNSNAVISPIHDRMPVVLDPLDYDVWLNPENQDIQGLTSLLRPADPRDWAVHPVSQRANSPRINDKALIVPIADPE